MSIENSWQSYMVDPLSAAISITPVYGLMAKKSDLQLERESKPLKLKDRALGGLKLAPVVGTIIGTQMVLQKVVEKRLDPKEKPILNKLKSAGIVAAMTSPALAVYNGYTMNKGLSDSLKGLKNPKLTGAIAVQETAFVAGMSVADPLVAVLKEKLGDNKVVECAGSFLSGGAGALAGHPANTALTRWQKELPVHPRQWMHGAPQRAIGTGIFAMIYGQVKKSLNTE